jgi:aminoglycoside phosphotransferase family enzyme
VSQDDAERSAAVVARWRQALQRQHGDVPLIETHISWVLLAGELAYKVKKPVRFGFLDFSTQQSRLRCCEEEVRLNRRLAPDLYRGVIPLHDGDRGPVVDHAVVMRRFPADALASRRLAAGRLDERDMRRLGERLARFHREAPRAAAEAGFATPDRIQADVRQAIDALLPLADSY